MGGPAGTHHRRLITAEDVFSFCLVNLKSGRMDLRCDSCAMSSNSIGRNVNKSTKRCNDCGGVIEPTCVRTLRADWCNWSPDNLPEAEHPEVAKLLRNARPKKVKPKALSALNKVWPL